MTKLREQNCKIKPNSASIVILEDTTCDAFMCSRDANINKVSTTNQGSARYLCVSAEPYCTTAASRNLLFRFVATLAGVGRHSELSVQTYRGKSLSLAAAHIRGNGHMCHRCDPKSTYWCRSCRRCVCGASRGKQRHSYVGARADLANSRRSSSHYNLHVRSTVE